MRSVCPHCGSFARVRNRAQITPLYSEALVECQSMECGWRGKIAITAIQTLTPSLQPHPSIRLPISPRARASMLAQLLPETN